MKMNLDPAIDRWTRETLEASIVTCERMIAESEALARRRRRYILLAIPLVAANALLGWRGLGDWWASRNAWDGTFAALDLLAGSWLTYVSLVKGVPAYLKTLSHMRRSQAYLQWLRTVLPIVA